jgi:preprotein translocase subunit YajC
MVESHATTATAHTDVHWQAAPAAQNPLGGLPFIVIMIGIFYFVLIRPQQKERKAHDGLVAGLQKGDKVVTRAGLHGRVHQVDEATIILEIADKVQVTIDKMSVTRKGDA